jgi:ATP-dependent protease ClpP protease subunit
LAVASSPHEYLVVKERRPNTASFEGGPYAMDMPGTSQFRSKSVILLNERISTTVKTRIAETVLAATLSGTKSLTLLIDCTGGDVEMAMQIFDTIRSFPRESVGIVIGECSSSAMLLLQACKKRFALPSARFMCHTLSFTYKSRIAEDSAEGFRIALAERLALSRKFDSLLCSRGIQDKVLQELKAEGDNEKLFSNAIAIEGGFIDKEIDDFSKYIPPTEAA